MPGIVGMISPRPTEECQRLVKAMVSSMEHEQFLYFRNVCCTGIGNIRGWVAHEDSFAAGQVFFNEEKDIAVLFSGECFADPETGAELKRKGYFAGGRQRFRIGLKAR